MTKPPNSAHALSAAPAPEPERFAGASIEEVYRLCGALLREAGFESHAQDAALLMEHVAGITRLDMLRDPSLPLGQDVAARLAAAVARRLDNEPVWRIIGKREFYGRTFTVTPAVLDPRPDSETLIEAALQWRREGRMAERPQILDFGTGSGILLLTLLAEIADATGTGIDISADALDVAGSNAAALGPKIAERARWVNGDAIPTDCGPVDVLVSNPPYIRSSEIEGLDPAVRRFDPLLALDGGADGLDFYRAIAEVLIDVVPEGLVFLEIGADQGASVSELIRSQVAQNRIIQIIVLKDLAGLDRCVAVQTRDTVA